MKELRTKNGAWGIMLGKLHKGIIIVIFIAGFVFEVSLKNMRWAYYD